MNSTSSYGGPERRRHRVYVTRNTEYHFRDDFCVGVKDLRTGSWLPGHLAVRRKLSCGLRVNRNGTALPTFEQPRVGESLYFGEEERELITSALTAVRRPDRQTIGGYVDPVCTG
ncbi:MAG: hypothetical protein QM756_18020 [Polyangiaceae bacterium]